LPASSRAPHPGDVAETARELDRPFSLGLSQNRERLPDLPRPHSVHPVRHWDVDGRLGTILNSKVRLIDDSSLNRLNLGILREDTLTSAGHRDRIESSREAVRLRGGSRSQNTRINTSYDPLQVATWALGTRRPSGVDGAASAEDLREPSRWPLRGQSEIQGEEERRSGVRHRFNNPADPWYGNLTRQDRRRVELGLWAPQAHSRSVSRREWTRIWIWFNRWACRIPHREERPLRHPDPNHPS